MFGWAVGNSGAGNGHRSPEPVALPEPGGQPIDVHQQLPLQERPTASAARHPAVVQPHRDFLLQDVPQPPRSDDHRGRPQPNQGIITAQSPVHPIQSDTRRAMAHWLEPQATQDEAGLSFPLVGFPPFSIDGTLRSAHGMRVRIPLLPLLFFMIQSSNHLFFFEDEV